MAGKMPPQFVKKSAGAATTPKVKAPAGRKVGSRY